MKPKIIDNVFGEDIRFMINRRTNNLLKDKEMYRNCTTPKTGQLHWEPERFRRFGIHNDALFTEIHYMLTQKVSDWVGMELKPSYNYGSFYGDRGVCPPHIDRDQCKVTLDYCISQSNPWPIYVNHTQDAYEIHRDELIKNALPYVLEENQALIFYGTEHYHYRNRLEDGEYCNMLFFHFVSSDFDQKLT